ncbi:MAG: glycyl-radical enzyme activating protein [Blautia sp.]|jgi:pyruvate formate lyase activating enzyme
MTLNIFDIQRFSVQDGPGIRTTVFLKGCPMRCQWCHNPESLTKQPNLLYYKEKCIDCGLCMSVCPANVHHFQDSGHELDRERCLSCGECAGICPERALELAGYEIGPGELMEKLRRDTDFYTGSGGGVTFSGGEPLLQAEELKEVMSHCKSEGISTAVETCSQVPWENYQKLLDLVDLWICDLKAVTPKLHKKGTGCENGRILENLTLLARQPRMRMWIRVPVIPGFNDSMEEADKIADFIDSLGSAVDRVEVMAYHDTGKSKYAALGWEYLLEKYPSMTKKEAAPYRERLERME